MTMGSQKHTSSLKHADADGTFTYDLKCPFMMQVPVKNRIVKMELYRTSSHTKSGKLLARACIPMFQLMGFTKGLHPCSFVACLLVSACCPGLALHCTCSPCGAMCSMQHATCGIQWALYSLQTCGMQHTACKLWRATCK